MIYYDFQFVALGSMLDTEAQLGALGTLADLGSWFPEFSEAGFRKPASKVCRDPRAPGWASVCSYLKTKLINQ